MLEAIDDFVAATQTKFLRDKWVDLSHEFPSYVAPRLMAEKAVIEEGGQSISWLVNKSTNGNAQTTGLFRPVTINVDDSIATASAPWRFQITGYGYDQREDFFQSSREKVISILKLRDINARGDMVKLQENLFWGTPTATTDNDNLMGVTFWVQKDATTTPNGAFNGGNPTGFSSGAGGISSTDVTAWRNWTGGYTTPNTDDLVKKIKRAMVNTDFEAPIPTPELGFGKAERCMYAEYDNVIEPLERLAETRNQSLGSDLAMYMGEVTIGRAPLKKSFWLQNNDTSYPVYGFNFGHFRPHIQKNLNMARLDPEKVPGQPHGRRVCRSHAMNWICLNRREQFVISKAA
jgi:hypothetical protein